MRNSACGSIDRVSLGIPPATENVAIASSPAGAFASDDLGQTCITPCTLPVSRTDGGSILIWSEGYRTERRFVSSEVTADRYGDAEEYQPTEGHAESEAITTAIFAVAAKDRLKHLDSYHIEAVLTPLKEGEVDPLAPDVPVAGDLFTSYRPVTGERIPIDISQGGEMPERDARRESDD